MQKKTSCIVFVCDKNYFNKFLTTCNQLLTNGQYKGDICLVIGDDLNNDKLLDNELITKNNIIIKYFPNIFFPPEFVAVNNKISSNGSNLTKKFQWHKLHLFNTFFKRWNFIFYIDCGITIFSDISPILDEAKENKLLAHSDAYPTYVWKLHVQFDKTNNDFFPKLNNRYNLNIDYFQTTMMLYDTNIIADTTFDDLYSLTLEYPISRTNDQGIISLYFSSINPLFEQIKTHNENIHFYDYLTRDKKNKYIMLKMLP